VLSHSCPGEELQTEEGASCRTMACLLIAQTKDGMQIFSIDRFSQAHQNLLGMREVINAMTIQCRLYPESIQKDGSSLLSTFIWNNTQQPPTACLSVLKKTLGEKETIKSGFPLKELSLARSKASITI